MVVLLSSPLPGWCFRLKKLYIFFYFLHPSKKISAVCPPSICGGTYSEPKSSEPPSLTFFLNTFFECFERVCCRFRGGGLVTSTLICLEHSKRGNDILLGRRFILCRELFLLPVRWWGFRCWLLFTGIPFKAVTILTFIPTWSQISTKNTSNVNPLTSLVLSHLPCAPTQIRLRVEYCLLAVFQSGVV